MDSTELREIAANRLTARRELGSYLVMWAGVSLLLVVIWAVTSSGAGRPLYFWPAWPILGIGIGAAVKAWQAYGTPSRGVTERDIDAEVARLQR